MERGERRAEGGREEKVRGGEAEKECRRRDGDRMRERAKERRETEIGRASCRERV